MHCRVSKEASQRLFYIQIVNNEYKQITLSIIWLKMCIRLEKSSNIFYNLIIKFLGLRLKINF